MHEQEYKAYIILLILGLILIFFLIIFILNIFKYQKKNRELFIKSLHAEMQGRELERKRIAKDIHDDLGATLSSANMYLQAIEGVSENTHLNNAVKCITNGIESLRTIMNDLYPISLDKYGLLACLNEFTEEIHQTGKMKITLSNTAENLELLIQKAHKIHLFRIIKEITHNTLKYAESKTLSIQFSEKENAILLETFDQGIGFDGNDTNTLQKGHGIQNIISRVELMGGKIYLDARPKQGVHYTIELPI